MTSAQALALTSTIIKNDTELAGPLLVLLETFLNARGDPMGEIVVRDVKRHLYARTSHSDAGMAKFISEAELDLSHLAA